MPLLGSKGLAGPHPRATAHCSPSSCAAFDLCGICCGAFMMPFWEFFGATLIGKGVVKVTGQTAFFIALFRCGSWAAAAEFRGGPWLGAERVAGG